MPTFRPLIDLAFRLSYRLGFALALIVWRLRRPSHNGALVAIRVADRILLVRQSYRSEFSLPGGGVHYGEAPLEAARREMVEELLLDIPPGELRHVHTETGLWDFREDTVDFFELRLDQEPAIRVDNREIIDARFVPMAQLPDLALTGPVRAYVAHATADAA